MHWLGRFILQTIVLKAVELLSKAALMGWSKILKVKNDRNKSDL